jgi:hypothetical protein
MLNTRLKSEGDAGIEMRQEIFNHLWVDVEIQLMRAGVKHNVGGIVKNLLAGYYGQTLGYDEGISKGDVWLASALWRNVVKSGDLVGLEDLTNYVRRNLGHVEGVERADLLCGRFKWVGGSG